jgi:hypothetical protein
VGAIRDEVNLFACPLPHSSETPGFLNRHCDSQAAELPPPSRVQDQRWAAVRDRAVHIGCRSRDRPRRAIRQLDH